jgi:preprotein translocase subunit YajC
MEQSGRFYCRPVGRTSTGGGRLVAGWSRRGCLMSDSLMGGLLLLAEDAGQAAGDAAQGRGDMTPMLVMLGLFVVVFYLLLMRPQRKEQAKRMAMIQALKPNDRVVTVGGLYGVVVNVHREADAVTLRVDDSNNTKVRITLGAVSRVLGDEPDRSASAK